MIEEADKKNFKRNTLINFAGYGFYMGCQWLVNVLAVRLAGFSEAGVLSLAISVTSIFYVVAHFNMRNYQVSDISNEFSDKDYITQRLWSCVIAVVLCFCYSLICGYKKEQLVCIIIYMLFKLTEAYLDVVHGIMQKNWKLNWIGYSFAIRGVSSILLFGVILAATKSVIWAVTGMCIGSFFVLLCYENKKIKNLDLLMTREVKLANIMILYKKSMGMFAYYFIFNLLTVFPRFILEAQYGSEILGIFTSIAAPVFIVQLSANLILNPIVNLLTESYEKKDRKGFLRIFAISAGVIFAMCLAIIIASLLLDDILLPLLFGEGIREYCYLFVPLIIATCLLVFSSLAFTVLTVIRELKAMVVCTVIAFLLCVLFTMLFVTQYGLDGMNITMLSTFFALDVIASIVIIIKLKKNIGGEL